MGAFPIFRVTLSLYPHDTASTLNFKGTLVNVAPIASFGIVFVWSTVERRDIDLTSLRIRALSYDQDFRETLLEYIIPRFELGDNR